MNQAATFAVRDQRDLADAPYDHWLRPDGESSALFFRLPDGYLIRFPDQADFEIDRTTLAVTAFPASPDMADATQTLLVNSIMPMIGNYQGGLYLHGSAVATDFGAIGFLGQSRSGKTTLAGAFARAGSAFLTEDVLQLTAQNDSYLALPSRPVLRVFPDSATYLLGHEPAWASDETKNEVAAATSLPYTDVALPLRALFILGDGAAQAVTMQECDPMAALARLMPHSFILDVEDRKRLRGHFNRLATLASAVPCFDLDYPRLYDQLPQVIAAVQRQIRIASQW